jgi:hypothetical protein
LWLWRPVGGSARILVCHQLQRHKFCGKSTTNVASFPAYFRIILLPPASIHFSLWSVIHAYHTRMLCEMMSTCPYKDIPHRQGILSRRRLCLGTDLDTRHGPESTHPTVNYNPTAFPAVVLSDSFSREHAVVEDSQPEKPDSDGDGAKAEADRRSTRRSDVP